MAFVNRVVHNAKDGAAACTYSDAPLRENYPALHEYLTAEVFEDGTARRTSTLLLFVEDGQMKACLNDRENSRSMWVSARTHEELLDALEAILSEGNGQWRTNRDQQGKGGKRSGK